MAKTLTNTQVKGAKPKEKPYKLFDINGLYLEVRPSGKKYWRLKYRVNKKDKTYTIGEYPFISLQEAREKVIQIKGKLQEDKKIVTLNEVVKEFLKIKKDEWSEKHYKDQVAKLNNYVIEEIGNKKIDEIEKNDIVNLIENISNKNIPNSKKGNKVELKKKVFLLIRQIFRFAMHKGYLNINVCDQIDIKELIPKHKEEHIKAITDENEFKNLVKALFELEGIYKITHLALKVLILTALRSGNIRKMQWDWIDFNNKVITIPASEMKTKQEFRVPLTDTLFKIFKEAEKMKRSKYVFYSPADNKKPLSENIFIMLLKRLGIENHKPHGFRSSFSTICYKYQHEHGFSAEVIETQLAHSIGNKVTRAYMRSDFLEERRKLLEWWESFLES